MPSPESLRALFKNATPDATKLANVRALPEPAIKYIIAMTPRSGSSHLCDVLKNSKAFGRPGEMMSEQFIPNIMKNAPGTSADDYLANILRVIRTPNGVSGLKASWFQFKNFTEAMDDGESLKSYRFIHLTRRDLAAQAVSLYRATSSDVFHTNIEHTADKLKKLEVLDYDYEQIKYWHKHIVTQEAGWRRFFADRNLFPLTITYEDIDDDVLAVVKRIAMYFGRPRAVERATDESVFRKLGARQSVEWACRFQLDLDAESRMAEAQPSAEVAPPEPAPAPAPSIAPAAEQVAAPAAKAKAKGKLAKSA